MKPILLGILCSVTALYAEQPVKELSTEAIPARASTIPLFRHGYLVLFPGGAFNGVRQSAIAYGFTAYSPNGHFAYQKILQLQGAHDPVVEDDLQTTRTDLRGAYRFDGLAPGNYRVLATFEYQAPDGAAMDQAGARQVQIEARSDLS